MFQPIRLLPICSTLQPVRIAYNPVCAKHLLTYAEGLICRARLTPQGLTHAVHRASHTRASPMPCIVPHHRASVPGRPAVLHARLSRTHGAVRNAPPPRSRGPHGHAPRLHVLHGPGYGHAPPGRGRLPRTRSDGTPGDAPPDGHAWRPARGCTLAAAYGATRGGGRDGDAPPRGPIHADEPRAGSGSGACTALKLGVQGSGEGGEG